MKTNISYNRTNKLFSSIVLLLVTVISLLLINCSNDKKGDYGKEKTDSLTVEIVASDSSTVLKLLKSQHEVDYQSSSMGVFVKGIDSVYNSSDHFWLYSVNDSMAKIACDKYQVIPGDTVRWHYKSAGQ